MTIDDITRLAQGAGMTGLSLVDIGYLGRFAALVTAAEREACAQAIESMVHGNVRTCAAAIRARSDT